jgi:hypothetical protein
MTHPPFIDRTWCALGRHIEIFVTTRSKHSLAQSHGYFGNTTNRCTGSEMREDRSEVETNEGE